MKPIAMRCNQHQFQEIKDILIENEVNIKRYVYIYLMNVDI